MRSGARLGPGRGRTGAARRGPRGGLREQLSGRFRGQQRLAGVPARKARKRRGLGGVLVVVIGGLEGVLGVLEGRFRGQQRLAGVPARKARERRGLGGLMGVLGVF